MNLHEAIGLMITGEKIKLPEWKGYWYIPEILGDSHSNAEKNVRVFTRDGEVLDSPWFEKYKDRTDFVVSDGKFAFGVALLALENGHRVARLGWNGKKMYLMMFKGQKDIANAFGYGYGESMGEFRFVDVIAIKSAQETMVLGWHASTPDMLSKDWVLVQ